MVHRDKSANLFDKDGDIITGKYIKKTDGSLVDYSYSSCQYIPFEGAGNYSLLWRLFHVAGELL